jgi:hypothetical protein
MFAGAAARGVAALIGQDPRRALLSPRLCANLAEPLPSSDGFIMFPLGSLFIEEYT